MLTYISPRRIGELQRLKLGRRENPSFDPRHPYLYKESGTWIIDVTPLACKTGRTYGHQKLRLPNLVFADGRSFYSYLEEWLDTWRQAYKPQHNFVFSTKEGQRMSRHNLSALFRTAVHRLTGKSLGPHRLRDICATYYLDREYSDAVINALAERMAHDPKILKERYDKRKGWQKNRPIEQAMKALLERLFDCTVR
jgi:integrase